MRFLLLGVVALTVSVASQAVHAAVVTFEDVTPVVSSIDPRGPCFGETIFCPDTLASGGYLFGAPDNGVTDGASLVYDPWFFDNGIQAAYFPHNGTQYIGSTTSFMTMTREGGGAFNLSQFDAAEGFINCISQSCDGIGKARHLEVIGTLAGGGTVSHTFVFDTDMDSILGPRADFETFILPSTFINLTMVSFEGQDLFGQTVINGENLFSIDNLFAQASSAVPAPGMAGLMLLGLGACAVRRRSIA